MSQVQRLGRQILEALLFLRERGFPSHGHLHSGNVILQNGVARFIYTIFHNLWFIYYHFSLVPSPPIWIETDNRNNNTTKENHIKVLVWCSLSLNTFHSNKHYWKSINVLGCLLITKVKNRLTYLVDSFKCVFGHWMRICLLCKHLHVANRGNKKIVL